jgi:hypothetical protein
LRGYTADTTYKSKADVPRQRGSKRVACSSRWTTILSRSGTWRRISPHWLPAHPFLRVFGPSRSSTTSALRAGVHLDGNEQPYAEAVISPQLSIAISHELLEMLVDLWGSRFSRTLTSTRAPTVSRSSTQSSRRPLHGTWHQQGSDGTFITAVATAGRNPGGSRQRPWRGGRRLGCATLRTRNNNHRNFWHSTDASCGS